MAPMAALSPPPSSDQGGPSLPVPSAADGLSLLGMKLYQHVVPAAGPDSKRTGFPTTVDCWWRIRPISTYFLVVDLVILKTTLGHRSRAQPSPPVSPQLVGSPSLDRALRAISSDSTSGRGTKICAFKLILPSNSGSVVASNFLEQRLVACPLVRAVEGYLRPLDKYEALDAPCGGAVTLAGLADKCGGLIELETGNLLHLGDASVLLSSLDRELVARLNLPWVIHAPVERKRVALVRGRPDMNAGGPIYRAVASLGMDLVIIDEESHWLRPDTPENQAIREAFLVTDMTEDIGVADRIIQSIRGYPLPIHGIFTVSDNFFVAVARAATKLGLPTNPVHSYQTSTDKYLSRQLQDAPGQSIRVTGAEQLKDFMAGVPAADGTSRPIFEPSFPMIVKPTRGWSSECVSKVDSLHDLIWAVDSACDRHGDIHACVVEPFFQGPEIDANFILLDGEILFSEVADEPPCDAEAPGATAASTFSSASLMLPSTLPQDEQQRAIITLRNILIKAGFRTGVLHCEARITNSKCEYRCTDGVVDLAPKPVHSPPLPAEEPACKLLEINARPPGFRVSLPTLHTYGVNYFQAHALAAVGDHARLASLSRAFDFASIARSSPHLHPQAQCWSQLVYIASPGDGVVRSESACAELMERRPDLARHIVLAWDYFRKGDRVAEMTDGAKTYVAYLLVWAKEGGRRRVMELGEEIRRDFRFELE